VSSRHVFKLGRYAVDYNTKLPILLFYAFAVDQLRSRPILFFTHSLEQLNYVSDCLGMTDVTVVGL